MALYTHYGYAPDALTYNSGSNTWTLNAAYDFTADRVKFEITDDDNVFAGDDTADETGRDANQTAVVTEPDGTPIATGVVYDEEYFEIAKPGGGTIWIEAVEIGGVLLGYIVSEELIPGTTYSQTGGGNVTSGGTEVTYSQLASVACYVSGTRITCETGDIPIEEIRPGMKILTYDNGFVPVLWSGQRNVSSCSLVLDPSLRPVRISAGALGTNSPIQTLLVSQQHRILLNPGLNEVFAPAKGLTNRNGVTFCKAIKPITYFHLFCEKHQIIRANGAWSESLFPGKMAFRMLGAKAQADILDLIGSNISKYELARPCLTVKQALKSSDPTAIGAKPKRFENREGSQNQSVGCTAYPM